MRIETIYVLLMWMCPLALMGTIALFFASAKNRPVYAVMSVGALLNFAGLIEYRVFHDPHGSFLLNIAAYPLLLVGGLWMAARAFARRQRRHA